MSGWLWSGAVAGLALAGCGASNDGERAAVEPGTGGMTNGSGGHAGGDHTGTGGSATSGAPGTGGVSAAGGASGGTPGAPGALEYDIRAIAYGAEGYVAVGAVRDGPASADETGVVYRSADGFDWEPAEVTHPHRFAGVAYGNGVFLVVATNPSTAYVSTDGAVWDAVKVPPSGGPQRAELAFGNGTFVLARADGVATSEDGRSWTFEPQTWTFDPQSLSLDIAFGAGRFIVWSPLGYMTSESGVDWVLGAPMSLSRGYAPRMVFARENGFDAIVRHEFCCLGEGDPPLYAVASSKDGLSWDVQEDPGASAAAIREPDFCVTFNWAANKLAAGPTCESTQPVVSRPVGAPPLLVQHEGPTYLIAGMGGIVASRDGVHYEAALPRP